MLTPDSILDLLQSLYLVQAETGVLELHASSERFGLRKPEAQGNGDPCVQAVLRCRELLDLPVPVQVEKCLMMEQAQMIWKEWIKTPMNVCFSTSGTEGEPKKCLHSYQELMEEATFLSVFYEESSQIISAAPAHHCYGFMFGVWMPLMMDVPVKRTLPFPSSFLSSLSGNAIGIGFPIIYDKSSPKGGTARLVSATAPLRQQTFGKMKSAGYRLIEIFGSSETGVLGYREDADAPFTLAPYFIKSGNALTRKYSGKRVRIMDRLEWLDDAHFIALGRRDHQIQIGGKNVSLSFVKNCICDCPGVLDCNVRLMRPEEGDRLKAFLVVANNFKKKELKDRISRLRPEERPQSLTFGPALPTNPLGKLCDW